MTLLEVTKKRKYGKKIGLYRCDCGKEFETLITSVNTGNTKSCGCLVGKTIAKHNTTHGLAKHSLYPVWNSQKQRCKNPNDKAYKDYGARGITIDESFLDFPIWLKYVLSLKDALKDDYTIDRKDNSKGYCIGNLRWVSRSMQMANTRLLKSSNSSGYRGVCLCRGKWQSAIQYKRKRKYLGVFNKKSDAVKAYDDFIIENKLPFELNIKDGNYKIIDTIQENKLGLTGGLK